MAEKGKKRQAAKVAQQLINQQENSMYYQSGGEWKSPSSPREITERRTLK